MSEQTEIMTIEEVAQYLRVSEGWVRDHSTGRRRPSLPSVKFGRSRRYNRAAVDQFVRECLEAEAARQTAAKRGAA